MELEMSFIVENTLAYLAHPRTGSSATEEVLCSCFTPLGYKTARRHSGLDDIPDLTGKELVTTTIRNPLDLMASWFVLNQKWHKHGIVAFIKDYRHIELVKNDRLFYYLDWRVDVVMHFETLQRDLDNLLAKVGKASFKLPVINKTENKKPFMEYHTEETVELLWERFPADMELYHTRKVK